MTKFTSDKQRHQTKQRQKGKQKLDSLSWEQVLDTSECFFQEFQEANKDCSLQYT
jgi:hypothetical protein